MRVLILTLISFFLMQELQAQQDTIKTEELKSTLISRIKDGELKGHFRNYMMNTMNKLGKNYYADAINGYISYETEVFKGLRFGVSGTFTYKVMSSDLNNPDQITGKTAKWEKELFDLNDSHNYDDLDRLEELYVKYAWKNNYFSYGKIPIELTPLVNKSDGRMKAFAFQGGWFHHAAVRKKWNMDLAWINKVSPRSMTSWYSFQQAIGIADNGVQPDGTKANYAQQTQSNGVGIFHLQNNFTNNLKVNFWNIHVDQVINTNWIQLDYSPSHWNFGSILAYQIPASAQQKLPYNQRYVQENEHGQVLSLHALYTHHQSKFNVAYTKAFSTGRFLFPKELGRDQFYTSMPRGRLEGLGDVQVIRLGFQQKWKAYVLNLDASTSIGADSKAYPFNKYKIDDFYQVNLNLHYGFEHFLKGLNLDLLYVWKENKHNHLPELMYQQSDYNQINFIANLNF